MFVYPRRSVSGRSSGRFRAVVALPFTAAALLTVGGTVLFATPAGAQSVQRVEASAAIAPSDTIVASVPTGGPGNGPEPSGTWLCPVSIGKFTNDWGQPRSGGRRHEGTDMLAPRGTPVIAPVAGIVKKSTSGSGGLTFNLKADDGFTYVGMHLSAYGADGPVQAGDVIGYVGDTGNAKGTNHLHFEIQLGKGAKTNPFGTLRKYCS